MQHDSSIHVRIDRLQNTRVAEAGGMNSFQIKHDAIQISKDYSNALIFSIWKIKTTFSIEIILQW